MKEYTNHRILTKSQELETLLDEQTKELTRSYHLIQSTLESTADGIITIDTENNILNYNQKFLTIWNIPENLLKENQTKKIIYEMKTQLKDLDDMLLDTQTIIEQNQFENYKEIELKPNRSIKYLEQFIQPFWQENTIAGIVYSFRDVTARKFLEKELIKQATYDRLTGLPNRALFIDRIKQSILFAERNKLHVAILFADLDSFKYINDSLGYDVGDELLKLFAGRLKKALRKGDSIVRLRSEMEIGTAARFGGDEFVILLLLNNSDINDVTTIINRLLSILNQPYHVTHHELTLTISVGISIYPKDGDNPVTLIKNADIAMSRAKSKGKGSIEFFTDEMSGKLNVRLEFENHLRHALENNELFLNYQPLLDLKTKEIVSLEALMRWKHPTLGIIPPAEFIPIAEESNLIIPMGTWALKTACMQNKLWQNSGLPKVSISINVSGQQFKKDDFIEIIKNILQETELEGDYLELELTESTLFIDVNEITHKIQELKNLGVRVNLDDFGTGYSSLSYINQFPIDKLKIDQSFIQGLSRNSESKIIIQAIMMIAKSFHMKVVAEGIETREQLDILRELKIDEVQGFYLSKPMSAADATVLLKNHLKWPSPIK